MTQTATDDTGTDLSKCLCHKETLSGKLTKFTSISWETLKSIEAKRKDQLYNALIEHIERTHKQRSATQECRSHECCPTQKRMNGRWPNRNTNQTVYNFPEKQV